MITAKLIAPCGMDCGLCKAYVREKNKCVGCRGEDTTKAISVLRCRIKNCEFIKGGKIKFCFSCGKFPCLRLKQLDKRYRTKYGMSMVENLNKIKETGLRKFVEFEKSRWACPECGQQICVHDKKCYFCEGKS